MYSFLSCIFAYIPRERKKKKTQQTTQAPPSSPNVVSKDQPTLISSEMLMAASCLHYYRKIYKEMVAENLKGAIFESTCYYLFFHGIKNQKRATRSLRLKRAFVTIATGQVCHFQL